MILLIDTCVVLDVLMDRKPFSADAYKIIQMVAARRIGGFITVKSMMDIHYVLKKQLNNESKTRKILVDLTEILEVIDSTTYCCLKALDSKITDYEDAMMSLTGEVMGADYFVTRNIKDYKHSKLKVLTPKEFINLFEKSNI